MLFSCRDHRYADPAETSYQVSRGKRMAALAEIELLKLRRVRAEMQHGRDVEYLMTQQLTAFKSRLMALPSRLAPTIVNRSSVGEVAENRSDFPDLRGASGAVRIRSGQVRSRQRGIPGGNRGWETGKQQRSGTLKRP